MELVGTLIIDPEEDRAIFLGQLVPMIIAGSPATIVEGVTKAAASLRAYLDREGLSYEAYLERRRAELAERGRLF